MDGHTTADLIGQLTRRDAEDLAAALARDVAKGRHSHCTAILHGIVLRHLAVEQRAAEAAGIAA